MLLLHGAMLMGPLGLLVFHLLFHINSVGVCAFSVVFGIDCPACGITRSATALYTGDIKNSFYYHPAGPMIVGIIALITLYLILVVFTNVNGLEWRDEVKASTRIEWIALASLLIGWVGKSLMN